MQTIQKVALILIGISMLLYLIKYQHINIEKTHVFITPWIWGFLTAHTFFKRQTTWLNELLGLGILVAMTIVLFFKQNDIIQIFTQQSFNDILACLFIVYASLGIAFGALLWPTTRQQ